MKQKIAWIAVAIIAFSGVLFVAQGGCSAVTEAVDNTAEVITGKQAIDQGQRMKQDLRAIESIKQAQFDAVKPK